jgi:hypothetical protein
LQRVRLHSVLRIGIVAGYPRDSSSDGFTEWNRSNRVRFD